MRRFGILFVIMVFSISASVAVGQFGRGGVGQKGGQQGGGKGNGPSPADMAKRLIRNFDKTGDGALNAQELTVAFTAMRQLRGAQSGQQPRGERGKAQQGNAQQGKGGIGGRKGRGGVGQGGAGRGGAGRGGAGKGGAWQGWCW